MKILFYISTLTCGGAERVITNLINEMVDRGHECVLVNTYHKEDAYLVSSGVRRFYLDEKASSGRVKKNIHFIRTLRKICKEQKADINLAFMGEPNIRLLMATLGLKQNNIVSVRNDPPIEYGKVLGFANKLFAFATGCVFQTEDAKNSFSAKVQAKGKIILNPVNTIFYDNRSEKTFAERKNIVAVGRLNKQKNYRMLMNSYKKIVDRVDNKLLIYGAGDQEEELKGYCKELQLEDNVEFMGVSDNISDEIKDALLYVMSSDYEGLPNALMEALALGIPTVSTDCPCGGPKMLLDWQGKSYGKLVELQNESQLAQAMLDIVSCEEQWTKYHEAAIQRAEQFRSYVIFNEWERYFESIVDKSQSIR